MTARQTNRHEATGGDRQSFIRNIKEIVYDFFYKIKTGEKNSISVLHFFSSWGF